MFHRAPFSIISSLAVLLNAAEGNPSLPFPLKPLDTFAPSYHSVKNAECRRHSQTFLKDLEDLKLWAVTMHDASGKISSGVLRGNVEWLGDATECHGVSSKPAADENDPDNIKGQYCVVRVFADPTEKALSRYDDLQEIFDLIHTHNAVQNSPEERIVFFPSFSPLLLGLCIPQSCDHNDLEAALSEWISPHNASSDVKIQFSVEPDFCTKEERSTLHRGAILTIVFYFAMTVIGISGTIYERRKEEWMKKGEIVDNEGKLTRAFLSFSFRSNLKTLLDTNAQTDELGCLNGIRTLLALFMYLTHKGFLGIYGSFSNREDLSGLLIGPKSMLMRSFWILVDPFVVMSGLLTSYYAIQNLQAGKKLNILKMYFQRYIKFTPLFLVCVLFLVNLTEYAVTDVYYTKTIKFFISSCKEAWLDILTYRNTRRGIDRMCYQPAHQLETDMHMYVLAPFLILILWKMRNVGVLCFAVTIAILSVLKYHIVITEKIATGIYYGINLQHMVKSANYIYLNFLHRLVPYLSGVLLGYFLRVRNKDFKFSKLGMLAGSLAAIYGMYYSFYSMYPTSYPGYVYNPDEAAVFGTLQPLLWSYSICWLITICALGQAECINRKLGWKRFQVTSKLAYAFYLVQIPIIIMTLGRNHNPTMFSLLTVLDLNVFLLTVGASIWLTLLFLLPIGNLWKIFTGETEVDDKKIKDK